MLPILHHSNRYQTLLTPLYGFICQNGSAEIDTKKKKFPRLILPNYIPLLDLIQFE
jgi:hypothetical protein